MKVYQNVEHVNALVHYFTTLPHAANTHNHVALVQITQVHSHRKNCSTP